MSHKAKEEAGPGLCMERPSTDRSPERKPRTDLVAVSECAHPQLMLEVRENPSVVTIRQQPTVLPDSGLECHLHGLPVAA